MDKADGVWMFLFGKLLSLMIAFSGWNWFTLRFEFSEGVAGVITQALKGQKSHIGMSMSIGKHCRPLRLVIYLLISIIIY